jgi:hypothetical protein
MVGFPENKCREGEAPDCCMQVDERKEREWPIFS